MSPNHRSSAKTMHFRRFKRKKLTGEVDPLTDNVTCEILNAS